MWVNFKLILSSGVLWCNISCSGIFGCRSHALLLAAKPQMETKHLGLSLFICVSKCHHVSISYLPQPEDNCVIRLSQMPLDCPPARSRAGFWREALTLEDVWRQSTVHRSCQNSPCRNVVINKNDSKLGFLGLAFRVLFEGCFGVSNNGKPGITNLRKPGGWLLESPQGQSSR